jgi:hypothetical protein
MSNACFQQATYDFSEVKKYELVFSIFNIHYQSLGMNIIIPELIPTESYIAYQRQDIVIIESLGVEC